MITLRPTTMDDYVGYFGVPPEYTMHLLSVVEDDKVVAIGGFIRLQPNVYMLVLDSDAGFIGRYRITITRAVKKLLKMAGDNGWKVLSYPDEEIENSVAYLEHFGFEPQGELYVWNR